MNLRKLRHAVILSRSLNFTRAARELNITQSALSRSIQALEAECRLQLFERAHGAVAVTQAGREFIRHAEGMLRSEAALRTMVDHASEGEGGHVTIGVTPLVARAMIAPLMAPRVAQPHLHAEILKGSSQEVLEMVAQERVDLGIVLDNLLPVDGTFDITLLAAFPLSVIVRAGHPLTERLDFNLKDLAAFPLIRSNTPFAREGASVMVGLTVLGAPTLTVEDYDVLGDIVAASDAIWITAPLAVQRSLDNGELVALPISWLPEDRRATIVAVHLKARTLSPIVTSLLRDMVALGRRLSE
ncbi:LysR family transcriptional regulator [Novosphingobium sp. 9U]|uniref:LysR family transcriptional regulator n=1 Tax=Novosphingobium sp. 9U TaxID=2653158 RepID=UPI0012F2FE07|nr:LysR family transcriptional regulator [Novosphingobium sp. 9U]VWX48832.1 conserved hypothetical protein [Novosphingobium sp. 9U]